MEEKLLKESYELNELIRTKFPNSFFITIKADCYIENHNVKENNRFITNITDIDDIIILLERHLKIAKEKKLSNQN